MVTADGFDYRPDTRRVLDTTLTEVPGDPPAIPTVVGRPRSPALLAAAHLMAVGVGSVTKHCVPLASFPSSWSAIPRTPA